MSDSVGSISRLIPGLRENKESAQAELFKRLYPQVCKIARKALSTEAVRLRLEEDIASMVLHNFFKQVPEQRFDKLHHREDIMQILAMLTKRRVIDQLRHENRLSRGGTGTRRDGVLDELPLRTQAIETHAGGEQIADEKSKPAEFNLFIEDMIQTLPTHNMQETARLLLQGWEAEEIARTLRCCTRSVSRNLQRVLQLWGREPS